MISPLQRYPLEQLHVKGIWLLDDGTKKAIVMTPSQEGVIVKVGDPISAGKILDIKKNRIVVRQYKIRRDGAREYDDEDLYLGPSSADRKQFISLKPGEKAKFSPPEEQMKPEEEVGAADEGAEEGAAEKEPPVEVKQANFLDIEAPEEAAPVEDKKE